MHASVINIFEFENYISDSLLGIIKGAFVIACLVLVIHYFLYHLGIRKLWLRGLWPNDRWLADCIQASDQITLPHQYYYYKLIMIILLAPATPLIETE